MQTKAITKLTFALFSQCLYLALLNGETADPTLRLAETLGAPSEETAPEEANPKASKGPEAFRLPEISDGDAATEEAEGKTQEIDGEEVYIMNEFEVSAEKDTGYYSANTLSGTRTNALIKDTPVSISVVNEQLIDDLNLSSIADLSEVLSSVDVDDEDAQFKGSGELNIRGLFSRNQLFEFFPRALPKESYNTGRIELIGGTNSLTVGQAEPGGKVNSGGKKATFGNDKTELEFMGGNFEKRGSFERNMQINDSLAVNVMGGYRENWREQQYSNREFKGATVAATYRPTNKTQIQLHLEGVSQEVVDAPTGFKMHNNIKAGLGLLVDPYNPDILDLLPEDLLAHGVEIMNSDDNKFAFDFVDENNAPRDGTVEDMHAYLEEHMIPTKDTGKFVGDDTYQRVQGHLEIIDITHAFSDNLQGKLAFFHETYERDYRRNGTGAVTTKRGDLEYDPYVEVNWKRGTEDIEQNSLRGMLSWTKELKKSRHQVLLGVDLDHAKARETIDDLLDLDEGNYTLGGTYKNKQKWERPFDITAQNPVNSYYSVAPENPDVNSIWAQSRDDNTITRYAGLWSALQSSFFNGRMHFLAGMRLNYSDAEVDSMNYQKDVKLDDGDVVRSATPNIGAVYWFTENVGIQGSWSRSVQSQDGFDQQPNGDPMPPEKGEGMEIGFRFDYPNQNISADLAYYKIVKMNARSSNEDIPDEWFWRDGPYTDNWSDYDPNDPNDVFDLKDDYDNTVANYKIPGTELTSEGIDLKLNYNPSKSLSFRLGYARNLVTTSKSPSGTRDGDTKNGNSLHRLTLNVSYAFKDGPLKGLRLGANQRYRSGLLLDTVYEDSDLDGEQNSPKDGDLRKWEIYLEDEWLTDAFVSWSGQMPWAKGRKYPKFGLQMNVKNVFDNRQLSKSGRPLSPRAYFVKASMDF